MNGFLLIISGLSGAGKDYIADLLLDHLFIKSHNFSRIVSYADRPKRHGEIEGYHHFFVTTDEINKLFDENKLAEKPVLYGSSHKATGKSELEKVLNGENKIWRIDPTLFLKIAQDKYFETVFDNKTAQALDKKSLLIFLTSPIDELKSRRMARDKDQYRQSEYDLRLKIDQEIVNKLKNTEAHIIENRNNQADLAVEKIITLTKSLIA